MFGLGTTETIIVVGVLVLFFGTKKIPDFARGMGEALRHIRNIFSDEGNKTDKKIKSRNHP